MSYMHIVEETEDDGHVTETLVLLALSGASLTVKSERSPDSQRQKMAPKCAAETQGQDQQDLHILEDTAAPVEIQDTVTEVVLVQDEL